MPRYVSPANFAERFGPDLGSYLTRVLSAAKDLTAEHVEAATRPRTPVGSGRDQHPGALAASLGLTLGGGLADSIVGLGTPYGTVVNRGRKRSRPYEFTTRTGKKAKVEKRMLGSKQTPEARRGLFRGGIRQTRREFPNVIEKAVAKVGDV